MELGSDFNLRFESLKEEQNTIYSFLKDFHTIYLESGRSGIRVLCNDLEDDEVLLPEYICDSVLQCFVGKKIKYYKLNSNLEINIEDLSDKINGRTSIVYLMHYFGSVQSKEINTYIAKKRTQYGFTIIEDTTHSIFSNTITIGDYCVCSLRKWFPIPDGGVLYSKRNLDRLNNKVNRQNKDINKIYGMILKTLYLEGIIDTKELYRGIFQKSEKLLDERNEVLLMSEISKWLLKFYNINEIVDKRRINYRQLENKLKTFGLSPICKIKDTDCPFTFPIKVNNRDDFRNYLIKNNIYCAVHWPIQGTDLYDYEPSRTLSEHIISLPIDQRYGKEDLDYLVDKIKKYERYLSYESNNVFG
jgi:dTDP-4-amino-4,6-dideoxygalactose transaminase